MSEDLSQIAERTNMFLEAGQAAEVVARQLLESRQAVEEAARMVRKKNPRFALFCARGSSDHATTYAQYQIERYLGISASSFTPSTSSVYDAPLDLGEAVFFVVSQSGRSPDIIAAAESAKKAGALVISIVNMPESPLVDISDGVVPICAGKECSVAATKTFIGTLAVLASLIAQWSGDADLKNAIDTLPEYLAAAWKLDWSEATEILVASQSLFTLGRGPGLAVAQEAALKFKETSGLHAEAFSVAEVSHGPMAISGAGFPILAFIQHDESREQFEMAINDFILRRAQVIVAGGQFPGAINLPRIENVHSAIEPILYIQSFYRLANRVAILRGSDPDRPPFLNKITETI